LEDEDAAAEVPNGSKLVEEDEEEDGGADTEDGANGSKLTGAAGACDAAGGEPNASNDAENGADDADAGGADVKAPNASGDDGACGAGALANAPHASDEGEDELPPPFDFGGDANASNDGANDEEEAATGEPKSSRFGAAQMHHQHPP
jgi:hypothetical protein